MREKLNSNPIAQVALIGVLIAGVAFFLLKGGGGESNASSATTASTTADASSAPTAGSPTAASSSSAGGEASTAASSGAVSGSESTGTAGTSEAPTSALPVSVPAPAAPAAVSAAYKAQKTVVLLVFHPGGLDERIVRQTVVLLKPVPKLAVFVIPAKQIARYTAVTVGVEVDQVPALIVMRPRRLSGGTPQASVSYGFQTPESVVQAVIDASSRSPEIPYHPN